MNWFDIVIVLIIGLFAYIGYRTGIVRAGFRIFGTLISFALASVLYPVFARVLSGSVIHTRVHRSVLQWINNSVAAQPGDMTATGNAAAERVVEALPFPAFMRTALLENSVAEMTAGARNTMGAASNAVANALTGVIINIIAFIVVLVVVRLLMIAAEFLLTGIVKMPVLRGINRLLGMGVGFVEGFLIVYLLAVFLTIFHSGGILGTAHRALQTCALGHIFYHNNIFLRLFFF